MLLTPQILRKIAANLSLERATTLSNLINTICPKYGINSKDVFEEFLANVLHESGAFRIRTESMNYTTPQRLVDIWRTRFTLKGELGKLDARRFVNNPILLANTVYGGRMGNTQTNDGWNFRGGGYIQITGRDAYTLYTAFLNKRDNTRRTIVEVAELVRTTDEYALDSACWLFTEFKNLEQLAIQDNFREVVKRINGGTIGMDDRLKYYNLCKLHLV